MFRHYHIPIKLDSSSPSYSLEIIEDPHKSDITGVKDFDFFFGGRYIKQTGELYVSSVARPITLPDTVMNFARCTLESLMEEFPLECILLKDVTEKRTLQYFDEVGVSSSLNLEYTQGHSISPFLRSFNALGFNRVEIKNPIYSSLRNTLYWIDSISARKL